MGKVEFSFENSAYVSEGVIVDPSVEYHRGIHLDEFNKTLT